MSRSASQPWPSPTAGAFPFPLASPERLCEESTCAHLAQKTLWKTFGMRAVLVPALIVGDHDCSGMVSGLVLRNDRTPLAAPGPSAPPSAPRRGRSMARTAVLQPAAFRASGIRRIPASKKMARPGARPGHHDDASLVFAAGRWGARAAGPLPLPTAVIERMIRWMVPGFCTLPCLGGRLCAKGPICSRPRRFHGDETCGEL